MLTQVALEAESTLTDRFQTTVPGPVRQALHLGKKDKIKYVIQADGSVLMQRAEAVDADPVLEQFLSFLAVDMQQHPEKLQPLTASMRQSVASLVADVNIDLDTPLPDELPAEDE
ncbi:regulator [Arsukibacterium sp. MJ3]|uniref:type II toxin-antitoxin system PrlF family antitoxin n=1 Tax=Arsukibacterium sp. MJ3 TaxID=1632859 RepID=UPI000626FD3C|nr:type II toxin-antitoxin system PrlF family antitoxin [Arsukibacterium sp. MJ3]KKO47582.1 regulator [Arsukibacterium sp. MJ3]